MIRMFRWRSIKKKHFSGEALANLVVATLSILGFVSFKLSELVNHWWPIGLFLVLLSLVFLPLAFVIVNESWIGRWIRTQRLKHHVRKAEIRIDQMMARYLRRPSRKKRLRRMA